MGIVTGNLEQNYTRSEYEVSTAVDVRVENKLDPGQFGDGRMFLSGNNMLSILGNDRFNVTVERLNSPVTVLPFDPFQLYDDDDFNSDNAVNGFDADNGEDLTALPDTYNLLRENDDVVCGDANGCNIFAAAYIRPDYTSWAAASTTNDVQFNLNVPEIFSVVETQIDAGRNLNSGENDYFWVAYLQVGYQYSSENDFDPNDGPATGGVTAGTGGSVDDVQFESQVPRGANGSLLFIETMRDFDRVVTTGDGDLRVRTAPHEIGHQFGISGDNPAFDFGVMNPSGALRFVDRHLNVIRWRRKSPGSP